MQTFVVVLIALIGASIITLLYLYLKIRKMLDQIDKQYTHEVISGDKRQLDFTPYKLDEFKHYDKIHSLVFEKDLEAIQQLIKQKELTIRELCLYYLTRVKKYQEYNSIIELDPGLLAQGELLDEKIAKGEAGSLAGVVILLKDNIASKKLHTSAGSYALRELTTRRNALIVDLLEKEDALIMGKSNLSEFANFMTFPSSNGFSVLGGQTKNPYGKFDVGGSSSGSCVAEALGLANICLGTETAGSLIHPAGQNSVVALKPSLGIVSQDLILPISNALDTAGVVARSVKDLALVFKSLVAPDIDLAKVSLTKDSLKGKVLGYYPGKSKRLKRILEELKKAGAEVRILSGKPEVSKLEMNKVLMHGIKYDLEEFLNDPAVEVEFKSLEEIVDYYKKVESIHAPYGIKLLEEGLKSQGDISSYVEINRNQARKVLDRALEEVDAIVSLSNHLSQLYAPAGYPAITVPGGYDKEGEPFGVTFIGGFLKDGLMLEIAYGYESFSKHRKPPFSN